MTPSRARVGDTVRILVHGFQVSLSLSICEGGGKWSRAPSGGRHHQAASTLGQHARPLTSSPGSAS